jgi:hypothetical protein
MSPEEQVRQWFAEGRAYVWSEHGGWVWRMRATKLIESLCRALARFVDNLAGDESCAEAFSGSAAAPNADLTPEEAHVRIIGALARGRWVRQAGGWVAVSRLQLYHRMAAGQTWLKHADGRLEELPPELIEHEAIAAGLPERALAMLDGERTTGEPDLSPAEAAALPVRKPPAPLCAAGLAIRDRLLAQPGRLKRVDAVALANCTRALFRLVWSHIPDQRKWKVGAPRGPRPEKPS